ncbi:MAG: carotenoid oxygenase family protein [Alphaproteobacteria bacterium]|nr:carotenoid oxygenase family protein [Alphaproteobacteria bacterium]
MPSRPHPYLSGNFAPLQGEDTFCDLPVTGALPRELVGRYLRNGPNPQFAPRDSNYHWFAGDGMVHAFTLGEGRASYLNRFVPTPKFELERAAGQALFGTFGNPLTSDPLAVGKDSGVANTNIVFHAGRLLALEEGHQPFELELGTLRAQGYRPYAGSFGRFTAHPKIDPQTQELLFFGYGTGTVPFSNGMCFGVVDGRGELVRLDGFEAPYAAMIHDFFVTRSYVVFPVLPLVGSLARAMRGQMPFAWEPQRNGYLGVMRRDGDISSLRWLVMDPCYVFHPMNMWEENDTIFVDVMEYDHAPLFPDAEGRMGRDVPAFLSRWRLDLERAEVTRTPRDDLAGEFPRVDERRAGLSYRHGWYAARTTPDGKALFNALAHVDHARDERRLYHFSAGDVPGEPVFVPRTADAAEGDGFVLATVYRGESGRSDLAVFEATDLEQGPIALVHLPRRIPFGFHGQWVGGL